MEIIVSLGIFLFLVAVVLFYFVAIYGNLIRFSSAIDKTWVSVDVLLRQRYDEIPKLIKVCRIHLEQEGEVLEKVTVAHEACLSARTVDEFSQAEGVLEEALGTAFIFTEKYPELKINQNFCQLQQRLEYLKSQIAERRRSYNNLVNTFNGKMDRMPTKFLARILLIKPGKIFKVIQNKNGINKQK